MTRTLIMRSILHYSLLKKFCRSTVTAEIWLQISHRHHHHHHQDSWADYTDSYSVSVPPPVLPQWHVEDSGHSAKSAVAGYIRTQRSQSGLTMPLSRHSVGTYQETSSHATSQGTLGHSRLSSLSHRGLILV